MRLRLLFPAVVILSNEIVRLRAGNSRFCTWGNGAVTETSEQISGLCLHRANFLVKLWRDVTYHTLLES